MSIAEPPVQTQSKSEPVLPVSTSVNLTRPKWCSPLAWQIFILIAGSVTILVGIAMLVLPGPGSLVIYAGIGILATEFIWAKQIFVKIRDCAVYCYRRLQAWWQK